ncbi:hypothetical protein JNW90_14295 [Micromonospora sp. STR1s_5]|nr:hypothetical protein [Micromonospora sp. STR1s_5]
MQFRLSTWAGYPLCRDSKRKIAEQDQPTSPATNAEHRPPRPTDGDEAE